MEALPAILGIALCLGLGLIALLIYAAGQAAREDERRRRATGSTEADGDLGAIGDADEEREGTEPSGGSWWDSLKSWFGGTGESGDSGGFGDGGGGADGGGGGD